MTVTKTALLGSVLAAVLAAATWSGMAGPVVRTAAIAFVFPLAFWGWVFLGSSLGGDPHGVGADALFILVCTLQGAAYALGTRWLLRGWSPWASAVCLCVILLHIFGVLMSQGLFDCPA